MAQPSFDPGLSLKVDGRLRRAINKDGSFNVHRTGARLRDQNLFQLLLNLSWPKFFGVLLAGYALVNVIFGGLYWWIGVEHLRGADLQTPVMALLSAVFFSAQTFTTVGYGGIAPTGIAANVVAALEAMTGVLGFAIATGLFYGRFARPSIRIAFSEQAIVAPFQNGSAVMFRVTNGRRNLLMELEITVLLMLVEKQDGQVKRVYKQLALERDKINFLAISWTVVHPIDEQSPFYGKTTEDLAAQHAELMILLKGFDETFGAHVHTRYSYRWDEIVWGARFLPMFDIDDKGDLILHVDKVGATENLNS
jgi:inward rectifier potassium channel